jgi:hypothetical protein
LVATALASSSLMANAGEFSCINGSFGDCALATSTLSWAWDGLDVTIANNGGGYVSEVYFDLSPGMSASFLGGTGTVSFYSGASPASLPGGKSVGFTSDASFDSDPSGTKHNGIDQGETAIFRITGASLNSFNLGTLVAGVHERSLLNGSASLVTVTTPVPEPETYALMGLGCVLIAWAKRRRKT